jgi:hypothetical protein
VIEYPLLDKTALLDDGKVELTLHTIVYTPNSTVPLPAPSASVMVITMGFTTGVPEMDPVE